MCAELVRRGVAIPNEYAATFADILIGQVVPKSSRGGRGPALQRAKRLRDGYLRATFTLMLQDRRAELLESSGKRKSPAGDLRELIASEMAPQLKFAIEGLPSVMRADEILSIVNRRNKVVSFDDLVQRL